MGGYETIQCSICNATISNSGAAKTSHLRSHVRDGSATEAKDENGRLIFLPTGRKPRTAEDKENEKKQKREEWVKRQEELKQRAITGESGRWKELWDKPTPAKGLITTPRRKVEAHVSDKGAVTICCVACSKKNKSKESSADPRFFRALCECGKITLLAKRAITGVVGKVVD